MTGHSGAIGIFDSGMGGLTVFARIAERLPEESVIYLGDTARVPYGTKSAETVLRYARACADVLLARGIKLLVAACNTASACAVPALEQSLGVPVIGVIEPGARAAVQRTRTGHIGVIGTMATVSSGAYPAAITALMPDAQVVGQACPLFVPLAEEGWTEGDVPTLVARRYLEGLRGAGIDTLVLGCTHYPLLKSVIGPVIGQSVALVDSAEETAVTVEEVLTRLGLRAPAGSQARREFLVSDGPENFARVGKRFLGGDLDCVEWIDF
jgi:glutamate racemase